MPELPEVETIVRSLRPHLRGAVIRDVAAPSGRLRHPVDVEALRSACCGQAIVELRRRAKYILVDLSSGTALVLHLGMTGAFRVVPSAAPAAPHERVVWLLEDGRSWRFMDPRRFGSVQVCTSPGADGLPAALAGLGPEPLEAGFDGEYLYRRTRGRDRPIKNHIMDQAEVVGVGNIYASEALFRAGISPRRRCGTLSRKALERLATAIREVLSEAIAAGGTTIDDFRDIDGSEGHFAVNLQVYGRPGQDCLRCGLAGGIRRLVQAGRSTYCCPRCQR